MHILLGTNNYFAVKRWPEPEVWVDIIKNKLGLEASDSFVLDELEQSAAYWKDAIARM